MLKKIHKHLIVIFACSAVVLAGIALLTTRKILAQKDSINGTGDDLAKEELKSDSNSPTLTPIPYIAPTPALTPATYYSTTVTKENVNITPSFEFSFPKVNSVVTGIITFKGTVESANKVEFYAIKRGTIDPKKYLGTAIRDKENGDNIWILNYNSKQMPNGDYEIFARVKNVYGSYESKKIPFLIRNEVAMVNPNTNKNSSASSVNSNSSSISTTTSTQAPTTTPTPVPNPTANSDSNKTTNDQLTTGNQSQLTTNSNNQTDEVSENQENDLKIETASNKEAVEIKLENQTLTQEQEAIKNDNTLTETEKNQKLVLIEQRKQELRKKFISRQELERIYVAEKNGETKNVKQIKELLKEDSDGDGLPDHEEERLGTDPFSADSDEDGFLDGDEVKGGFDPLKYSAGDKSDKIVYQEPKVAGSENDLYEVTAVDYAKKTSQNDDSKSATQSPIVLKGKALPSSFVTLFIYSSDPIVVTVKTNDDGSWSYVLDKELADGTHEVYAAVTDNTGAITAKSKAFAFIKTAQAIEKIGTKENLQTEKRGIIEEKQKEMIVFVVLISITALLLAFASVLLFIKHHLSEQQNLTNVPK